jgi:hypothetical protein
MISRITLTSLHAYCPNLRTYLPKRRDYKVYRDGWNIVGIFNYQAASTICIFLHC